MNTRNWTPLNTHDSQRYDHVTAVNLSGAKLDLPIFPKFKKLELSDKDTIENFVKQFPPYSDFNFVSLWSYNIYEKAEISFLNENLVIKYHDYITGEPFYTFIGVNNVVQTVELLLEKSKESGLKPELQLIPEIVIEILKGKEHRFYINEDLNNRDYVYLIDHHINLRGKKFHDRKRFINFFKKKFPDYYTTFVDLNNHNAKLELEELFVKWQNNKNLVPIKTEHELNAIKRLLKSSHILNMYALGLYINTKLIGYLIANVVHDNYAIAHFEKIDISYKGASAILKQELAIHLNKLGCEFINYEQDLGILGIRQAKLSWNPYLFLYKYKITYS